MELNEILSALEENTSRKFPRLAVEEAIAQQEAITPFLLKALEDAKTNIEEIDKKPGYFLHIYALYLLAQFREPKAYPLVVDFFSIPGNVTLDVTGDLVTEDLGRILASVYEGDLNPIKQLIETPTVNEYVRGAALNSFLTLAAQDVISRQQALQYFQTLFSTFEKADSHMLTNLIMAICSLYPTEELLQLIDQAYEKKLVDKFFFARSDVDYYLHLGREGVLKELREDDNYSLVEDTVAEMEWWACFQEVKPKSTPTTPMPTIPREKPRSTFTIPIDQPTSTPQIEEFWPAPQSPKSKAQKKKKRQMQKQSRKKNRSKKK
ncbi:MAG: DUF1186 domain-containing protein [Leptolyngbyaceae cyanobacterium MO_188.B28]|nr:DUF1186 domain-containing protein [Leptolyngbyaceae cyanobacterium MO_188.B28]